MLWLFQYVMLHMVWVIQVPKGAREMGRLGKPFGAGIVGTGSMDQPSSGRYGRMACRSLFRIGRQSMTWVGSVPEYGWSVNTPTIIR